MLIILESIMVNCNNPKHNHKLKKLLKISQTQMKLFPHGVTDEEREDTLVNIIDHELAICSICDNEIPFDRTDMTLIPEDYSTSDQNLYADSEDITEDYNIRINPKPAENWISPNQDGDKKRIVNIILKMSSLFKSIGNAFYSEIVEPPYVVRPDLNLNSIMLRDGSSLELSNSIVTVETDGPVAGLSQVTSWIINREIGPIDYKNDVATAPLTYLNIHVLRKLNSAILVEFSKRLVLLFERFGWKEIFDSFLSELPLIRELFKSKEDRLLLNLIRVLRGDLESSSGINSFKAGQTAIFLTAVDNLEAKAKELAENNITISTSGNYSTFRFTTAKQTYSLPICESCALDIIASCADCGRWKYKTEMQNNSSDELICSRCGENYSYCEDCSKMILNDDTFYSEKEQAVFCGSCWEDHKPDKIDTDNFSIPKSSITSKTLFPYGNKEALERLMAGLKSFKIKTRGGPPDKCMKDMINIFKANGFKENEAVSITDAIDNAANLELINNPVGTEDFKWYIQTYIDTIENSLNEQYSFYSKYPLAIDQNNQTKNIFSGNGLELLKNYQPMPVNYEYDAANRGKSNFVIKMVPSGILLEQAETLFPGFGKKAWSWFSRTGTQHHPGCIAYARIASYDDYLVIDNFQRDADANNGKPSDFATRFSSEEDKATAEKVIKWWDKRTSKWYVQFASYLVDFAKENNKELYLTNFETQKAKWSHIPEKNREVYDNLPEEMASAGFYKKLKELRDNEPDLTAEELKKRIENGDEEVLPTHYNSFDGKVEDLRSAVGGIWRLAKKQKIFNIYKKAAIQNAGINRNVNKKTK